MLSREIFFLFVIKGLIINKNMTTLKNIRETKQEEHIPNPLQYHSSVLSHRWIVLLGCNHPVTGFCHIISW